jgi:DNA-3-methyladenine glycosylase
MIFKPWHRNILNPKIFGLLPPGYKEFARMTTQPLLQHQALKQTTRLGAHFYEQDDVLACAQALLGKVLISHFDGQYCAGIITETEAYRAPDDKASHAYNNRRTKRTEIMFHTGGHAYIYLCYGIHHLFNVVTGPAEMAHAVLIRAIEPWEGLTHMRARRGLSPGTSDQQLGAGPGTLSKAMGFHTQQNGALLTDPKAPVWIEDAGINQFEIARGPRIGVDYAAECAAWPWRFWVKKG